MARAVVRVDARELRRGLEVLRLGEAGVDEDVPRCGGRGVAGEDELEGLRTGAQAREPQDRGVVRQGLEDEALGLDAAVEGRRPVDNGALRVSVVVPHVAHPSLTSAFHFTFRRNQPLAWDNAEPREKSAAIPRPSGACRR